MKKILLLLAFIAITVHAGAQTPAPIDPNIPPYHILTTDSTYSTPAKLKKNTRVMIIYFSPDCSHCQHLISELKPKMKELGNTQIVMITWSVNFDIKAIKKFYHDYGLAAYPNITIGTEGYTYVVQKYYQVTTTPFIAIYNNSGKMVKSFNKSPNVNDVIASVKKAQ